MENIISWLQTGTSFVIPMVVLLGLLIFVHEMGHFLVAKYYKVRVEVFSLGFGPKLFKFKRGDTVYAISAIPLGGYVKMFGDDPTAEVESDQKAFAFNHKPVGQRIAIVLAGPLVNFFFAIILFAGVAMIGEQALAPKLGDIEANTPAAAAGFKSGDTIVSVDSKPVTTWDEFQKTIESGSDRSMAVVVDREGKQETLSITPKEGPNKNILSWDRHVGQIDGLSTSSRASVIGVRDEKSLAAVAGLATGDIVQKINGAEVTKWRELVAALEKNASSETLAVEVQRGILDEQALKENKFETKTINVALPAAIKGKSADEIMKGLGVESPEMYLGGVEKDSPAAKAGLQKGDRIIAIDGTHVSSFEQVSSTIRSFGKNQPADQVKPLSIVVARGSDTRNTEVIPNERDRMNNSGREERRFEIGIRPLILDAAPATLNLSFSNPIDIVSRGITQTWKWTSLTVLSFVRLFQNEVSPKNIGGFLSIGQMAQKSWAMGPSQFLHIMAIISINLFILNLLPVPVLDGGHLVFYSIEAVKGAPLSMKKMEIAQQVGLVLLLGLMVFALYNDFSRLLFS